MRPSKGRREVNKMKTRSTALIAFGIVLMLFVGTEVVAQSCHTPAAPAAKPNKMAIPDVKVLDQEGHAHRVTRRLLRPRNQTRWRFPTSRCWTRRATPLTSTPT